jgi:outer membrane biosynthesis protein TonB
MVLDEQRSAHLGPRARAKVEERLAKKRKRLARRRDEYPDSEAEDEDVSDWEESDWEEEPEDDEPLQEVRFGVHFVRHKKTHKVGGRLRLDDAIGQLAAAQAAAEAAKKKAEEAAAAGVAPEGAAAAEGTDAVSSEAASDGAASDGAASPEAAAAPAPAAAFNLEDLMEGWSDARKKAWSNREKNENQYYYRFNAPGEAQGEGKWSEAEHELFLKTLEDVRSGAAGYPMYQWGSFSKNIPGRVGYQCSNYYRTLIKNGEVEDANYMVDEKGQMRFNFKNKGFERVNKETGDTELLTSKPKKPKPPPKPKKPKAPKAPKPKPKPKKKAKDDDDKAFHCSVKLDATRRSGRNAGVQKKYTDGDEVSDDEEEEPVLPGFIDPLTKQQIEEPAISPYGHVAGYETWCRALRSEDAKDTCPFTRQPLKRRDLVKLTHENIAQYREKMVDTQNA